MSNEKKLDEVTKLSAEEMAALNGGNELSDVEKCNMVKEKAAQAAKMGGTGGPCGFTNWKACWGRAATREASEPTTIKKR
jgi:hypothetical protein